MKILEPYIEIKIISEEQKVYKWLKIISNSAYHNNEGLNTSHFKINGNEFLKILEHHKQSVIDFYNAKLSTNDMFDLCYIKIVVDNKLYEFNFNYENSNLLNFANILYSDFKYLIDFHYLNYEDIEWNIIKDIKDLPLKTKFVLDDYFKKYGIISKDDKIWLYKKIEKQINDFVEIKKKTFKPMYLCESIKI
ncbi:MAG: hypothetical protein ACI4L1_00370 [Christensenellales bacterium]